MRIVVDHERCVASGSCVTACPEVFGQDEEGIVVVLQETPPEDLMNKVDEAIAACPTGCIWLESRSEAVV